MMHWTKLTNDELFLFGRHPAEFPFDPDTLFDQAQTTADAIYTVERQEEILSLRLKRVTAHRRMQIVKVIYYFAYYILRVLQIIIHALNALTEATQLHREAISLRRQRLQLASNLKLLQRQIRVSTETEIPLVVRRPNKSSVNKPKTGRKIIVGISMLILLSITASLLIPSGTSLATVQPTIKSAPHHAAQSPRAKKAKVPTKTTNSPLPVTPQDQNNRLDNVLAPWILRNSVATEALKPWQDDVLAVVQDPRIVAHRSNGQPVNILGGRFQSIKQADGTTPVFWVSGQERMLYSLMLIRSAGNPYYQTASMNGSLLTAGLIPLDTETGRRVAKEIGTIYAPLNGDQQAVTRTNLLLASRRINDLYAGLLDSKLIASRIQQYSIDELKAERKLSPMRTSISVRGQAKVLSEIQTIFPIGFLTEWYGVFDLSGISPVAGSNDNSGKMEDVVATLSLYFDWSKQTSREATLLFSESAKNPKSLTARLNKAILAQNS
jgi:hypothetical protein